MEGTFEPADERPGSPDEPPELSDPAGSGGERQTDPVPGHRAKRVRYSPQHAWGRVAQRWVPEPLRDARVDPGRRGALLLTVVAAVAALVAAVGVWRDQPTPVPVQAVSLAQVSDATAAAGGPAPTGRTTNSLRPATATKQQPGSDGMAGGTAAGGTAAGGAPVGSAAGGDAAGGSDRTTAGAELLVVSVTGAVRHPGLVRLPPGSRVADAIGKAGGTTSAADLTGLNLAARLTDGASVVVSDQPTGTGSSVSGSDAGAGGSASTRTATPAGKVDLNTADVASLDALPGVGPVTAAAIVAWREKNGRYTSVEQLQEIQGIGPAKYAALAALVTV